MPRVPRTTKMPMKPKRTGMMKAQPISKMPMKGILPKVGVMKSQPVSKMPMKAKKVKMSKVY